VCGLPKFFRNILFDRIDLTSAAPATAKGKVTKQQFVQFWKKEFEKIDVKKRMFKLIAKLESPDVIVAEDFKPLFRQLLDTHPGLEFLQATPEF
jgi:serine/threonine-protein phosphatase 2A regulatory subunit B''